MGVSALRIGEVALRSGVSIDTVRYYERRRLLPTPARSSGGFRLFDTETVVRLQFIKQAQELGFSLDEIGAILITGGESECRRVRDQLKTKVSELDQRVRSLQDFKKTLVRHLAACERELRLRRGDAVCPVLIHISDDHSRKKKKK